MAKIKPIFGVATNQRTIHDLNPQIIDFYLHQPETPPSFKDELENIAVLDIDFEKISVSTNIGESVDPQAVFVRSDPNPLVMKQSIQKEAISGYGGSDEEKSFELDVHVGLGSKAFFSAVYKSILGKDYLMALNVRSSKFGASTESFVVHELQHYLDYLHHPEVFSSELVQKTRADFVRKMNQSLAQDRKIYFEDESYKRRRDSTAADIAHHIPLSFASQFEPKVQTGFIQAFNNQRRRYMDYYMQPAEDRAEQTRCKYIKSVGVTPEAFLAKDGGYSDVHRDEIGYYNILDVPLPSGEILSSKSPLIPQIVDHYRPCFE